MKEWGSTLNLIRELVLKDLKVRYSRPMLGFFWAFLSPLLTVLIFYLIFGLVLKIKTQEAPFILYLMSGVFPWVFFQDSVSKSVTSLIDNKNLLKESNFQHYLIPFSIVIANAVNFLPALFILIFTSLFIMKGLSIFILLLPFVLTVHLSITMGLSVIISILYVKYRDTRYVLDAMILLLFYLAPVFYSVSSIRALFSTFLFNTYMYNPFVGMLNLYRIALLKGFYAAIKLNINPTGFLIAPFVFGFLILLFSCWFYQKNKTSINDYLAY